MTQDDIQKIAMGLLPSEEAQRNIAGGTTVLIAIGLVIWAVVALLRWLTKAGQADD
jgi:hypothetical protein